MATSEHDQSEKLLYVRKAVQSLSVPPNVQTFHKTTWLTRADFREYLKRDDQILPLRLLQEERRDQMTTKAKDKDRTRNQDYGNEGPANGADIDMEDDVGDEGGDALTGQDALGSKVIVIHPGSQNLRIGLANDALPKSVPMVIARRAQQCESEEDGGEPAPKRLKLSDGEEMAPEKMFGEEVRIEALLLHRCADYL